MIELADLDIAHHFAGGVYAKRTDIPAGTALAQHRHAHDHLSILAAGRVVLRVDGQDRELTAPACVTIEAHKHHGVHALTDAVWFCIWPDDMADDERIEQASDDMLSLASSML